MGHETQPSDLQQAWAQSGEAVTAALASDSGNGLTADEARNRLARFGPNRLSEARPDPAWWKFLRQFSDTLVLLLIAAAAVSAIVWVLEGEDGLPYEAMAILSIVALNAVMGFVQQTRAEEALAALREMRDAARAVSQLARTLERNPGLLLRGR